MSLMDKITQPISNMARNVFGGGQGGGQGGQGGGKPIWDEDLVDFVEKEYTRRIDERRPFELQWRLNLAFYEGNQLLDINTASMALEEQPIMYDWQEREVFNQIMPNINTRISKFKRVRSILKSRPGTTEQADVHSAKVGTMFLRQNDSDIDLRSQQTEEYGWMEICGTVFRGHFWDPNAGKVIGKIIRDSMNGGGEPAEHEVREGDMDVVTIPPQEMLPESCFKNEKSQKSWIRFKAYKISDIEDAWGVKVSPEKAEAEKLQRAMTGLSGLGYGQGGFLYHNVKLENHAIVKEYWELPSKKYPEGRLIITASKQLLYSGPMPYRVGEDNKPDFPWSMLVCIQRPGVLWGKTILEMLIPVQRRYNALKNRKAEYLNRQAIGVMAVEVGAIPDMDKFEQDGIGPGSIVEYQRGFNKPSFLENQQLPTAFETEEAQLLNLFSILSGVSEISRQSNAPTGVKSGVALAIVQEQDDTRLSNTVENIERFNIHSGKIRLRLAKQFVQAPRALRIAGKNNVVDVMDWVGSDIRGEDIILDNMSAIAESPAQKRQMVFDLMESGLLFDPETGKINREMRSKIFEMIEMGEWESADDEEELHLAKAERENRIMAEGGMPIPVSYDDHISHIARHNRFRLTTDYEEMIAENPQLEQVFDAHVDEHLMFLTPPETPESMMGPEMGPGGPGGERGAPGGPGGPGTMPAAPPGSIDPAVA